MDSGDSIGAPTTQATHAIKPSANVVEGIQQECERCRELIKLYEEIGPAGTFAKAMIRMDIREGEAAIASGDVVRMVRALVKLKDCE